jgi:hypothetical protein
VGGVVVVGVDHGGSHPAGAHHACDVLLSADPAAPRPWVGAPVGGLGAAVDLVVERTLANPLAAVGLAQLLRLGEHLSLAEAVALESLTFSMLLAGPEFRRWRAARPPKPVPEGVASQVHLARHGDVLRITLDRPSRHNAYDAALRDQLVEALRLVAADDSIRTVVLDGEGPSFSSGGDLDEFGSAPDPARAHLVRLARSAAVLVAAHAPRITARLHGACIGAGLEVPAAAGRVEARRDAVLALPEVAMGLVPGAGGTATVPRRIGRHRACWLGITGARLDARQALAWGLVDEVVEGW